jgi:hypothetical protein
LNIGTQVSGAGSENARADLKPDTRNLKPRLGEGFITPDIVQKKPIKYLDARCRLLDTGRHKEL